MGDKINAFFYWVFLILTLAFAILNAPEWATLSLCLAILSELKEKD